MRPEVQYLLDKTLWGIESVKINSSSAEFGPVAPLKSRKQSFVHPSPGTKGPVATVALCKVQRSPGADDAYQGVLTEAEHGRRKAACRLAVSSASVTKCQCGACMTQRSTL